MVGNDVKGMNYCCCSYFVNNGAVDVVVVVVVVAHFRQNHLGILLQMQ